MNIDYYNAGREAGISPWAIRANGLLRLGELRGIVPLPMVNTPQTNSSDSTSPVERRDDPDSGRCGFLSRLIT